MTLQMWSLLAESGPTQAEAIRFLVSATPLGLTTFGLLTLNLPGTARLPFGFTLLVGLLRGSWTWTGSPRSLLRAHLTSGHPGPGPLSVVQLPPDWPWPLQSTALAVTEHQGSARFSSHGRITSPQTGEGPDPHHTWRSRAPPLGRSTPLLNSE